jgi:uncharacterized protein (DUF2336 family)
MPASIALKTGGAPEPSRSLIDELIASVACGSAKHRLRVLQGITDLFVAGARNYTRDQIALFDDVLQQLSAEIELKARAKLAERLAGIDSAPPRLIRVLAFDNAIEVAAPVLTHSTQLSDNDLVESASTKSQKHLYAIAQRLKLSEPVTDVLVERGNRRVVRSVASNPGARFSLAGYGKLTARARYDRKLTLTVGQRSDIPRQYFLKLLETASASVRAKLEAANPAAAAAVRDAVGDIASDMQNESRMESPAFAIAARDAKRRFSAHTIREVNVHAPAKAQEFEKTAVALAKLGCLPLDLVERALLDEGEDMVLLLAKSAGCSWVTARELLQMYAARRRLQPDDLSRAFDRYERLSRETAQRVIKFYQRRMKRRAVADGHAEESGKGGPEPCAESQTTSSTTAPPTVIEHPSAS